MKHRGEIVQKRIEESGKTVAHVARALKKDRSTLYRWFAEPNLPLQDVVDVGKVISYNFAKDFPQLYNTSVVEEPQQDYGKHDVWKDKYIALLEEHNKMLNSRLEGIMAVASSIDKLPQGFATLFGK